MVPWRGYTHSGSLSKELSTNDSHRPYHQYRRHKLFDPSTAGEAYITTAEEDCPLQDDGKQLNPPEEVDNQLRRGSEYSIGAGIEGNNSTGHRGDEHFPIRCYCAAGPATRNALGAAGYK